MNCYSSSSGGQSANSTHKVGWRLQFSCIVLGFILNMVAFPFKALGVFFIQFQDEFSASAALASFTIGLPGAIVFVGGPVYGAIINTIGIRAGFVSAGMLLFLGFSGCFFASTLLYAQIFMGIIAGFGAGLNNNALITVMGRSFYTSRPVAIGALAMGSSTVTAFGSPALQLAIDHCTWRGAFALLGAYCLNAVALGLAISTVYETILQKRQGAILEMCSTLNKTEGRDGLADDDETAIEDNPECKNTELPTDGESSRLRHVRACGSNFLSAINASLLKDPWFVCYCTSCGFSISSRILSGLYLVRYAQSLGIGDYEAARNVTIAEAAAFATIPIIALMTSVKKRPSYAAKKTPLAYFRHFLSSIKRSYLLSGFQVLMALVIFLTTLVEANDGLTVCAVFLGICYGVVEPITNVVLADLFGAKRLPGAIGYRSFASGIMILGTPALIGYLIDQHDDYKIAQYTTSAIALLAGILTSLSQAAVTRRQKRAVRNTSAGLQNATNDNLRL